MKMRRMGRTCKAYQFANRSPQLIRPRTEQIRLSDWFIVPAGLIRLCGYSRKLRLDPFAVKAVEERHT